MGQYYVPINIDKKECYDLDMKKLLETSWVGNNNMNDIEFMLLPGGGWYKNRIIWAGDYGDPKQYLTEAEYKKIFKLRLKQKEYKKGGESEKHIDKINLYHAAGIIYKYVGRGDQKQISPIFFNNLSKKVFVDPKKMPTKSTNYNGEKVYWTIHPLPLLLAQSNGRGSGDYSEECPDIELVGSWVGDVIFASTKKIGYKELNLKFSA